VSFDYRERSASLTRRVRDALVEEIVSTLLELLDPVH
jgi:hypothetical protein